MNPQVVFFLGYLGPQLEKARERENEKRKTFWCRSPKRLSKARTKKKSQNQNRLNLRSPRILIVMWLVQDWKKESESHSVMSDSLWPQGLYSPCNSPGQNTGVGSHSLPGDLSNPGMESRSPTLQVDSLPAEPPGKPKNTGVGSYPFSSRSSWPRNQTGVSCIAGGFFTNWAMREAHMQVTRLDAGLSSLP